MTAFFYAAHEQDHDRAVSLTAFDQYMRTVSWTPVMTDAERVPLIERIERGKRERASASPDWQILADALAARDLLIESFQRLVIFLVKARQYRYRSMDFMDIVQEANLALLRMIDHYTLIEVDGLGALAAACIRHGLSRLLRDGDALVRVSGNVVEAIDTVKRVTSDLQQQYGCQPSYGEIAQAMDVPEAKVREWLAVEHERQIESLQVVMSIDEDETEHLCAFTSFYPSPSAAEVARQEILEEEVQQAMRTALTLREQQVVTLHYGLEGNDCHTNKAIAALFGVSEPAVWSAGKRAKTRLHTVLQNAREQHEWVA